MSFVYHTAHLDKNNLRNFKELSKLKMFNSFYFMERRKSTNSVIKVTIFLHGGKSDFFLPYVLDLIHLLEQNFCPDSNLRVKTMYESAK